MKQIPDHAQTRLYPYHFLKGYDKSLLLVYAEGEKDVVTLLSQGIQSITHTNGALSVPKDLSALHGFQEMIIAFDNDVAGLKATERIVKRLRRSK